MSTNINLKAKKNDEEVQISLFEIIGVILRRWWLILIAMVVFAAAAYGVTRLVMVPTYQSYFTAYVNNNENRTNMDLVSSSDITAARDLTSTYAVIITSEENIQDAIDQSGLDITYAEVKSGISVTAMTDTEVIQISVITEDPETSYKLAAALEECSPDYVADIVSATSMKIVHSAKLPTEQYGPDYMKSVKYGALLGAFLVIVLIVIRFFMDTRVKSMDELERYNLIVIGNIHDLTVSQRHGYYGYTKKGGKENGGK